MVVERWRDTVVTLPPDSAWLRAWMECDSTGNVLLRELQTANGKTTSTAITVVRHDTVTLFEVNCNTDSLELQLKIRDRQIRQLSNSRTVETVEVEKRLTWWQITQIYSGRIFLALIAALAVFTVTKLYLKR